MPRMRTFPQKESALNTACERLFRVHENMGSLVYQKNNSGAITGNHGRWIRFGKKGSPDFYLFFPGGRTVHLELKTAKGVHRDSQKKYKQLVESLGHKYLIARNLDQVLKIIETKGVV